MKRVLKGIAAIVLIAAIAIFFARLIFPLPYISDRAVSRAAARRGDLKAATHGLAQAMSRPVLRSYPSGTRSIFSVSACGGVIIFLGDLVLADESGVLVIPAHLAKEAVEQAAAKEKHDVWPCQQVDAGAQIQSLYQPNKENLERYQKWLRDEAD